MNAVTQLTDVQMSVRTCECGLFYMVPEWVSASTCCPVCTPKKYTDVMVSAKQEIVSLREEVRNKELRSREHVANCDSERLRLNRQIEDLTRKYQKLRKDMEFERKTHIAVKERNAATIQIYKMRYLGCRGVIARMRKAKGTV